MGAEPDDRFRISARAGESEGEGEGELAEAGLVPID